MMKTPGNKKAKIHQFVKKNDSSGWFRSIDLWVMGPARFHCATLLLVVKVNENHVDVKIGVLFMKKS